MICTPANISLIAKMAEDSFQVSGQVMAQELYSYNIAAEPPESVTEARSKNFLYDPTIRPASFLPTQKIEAIREYQKQCSASPLWQHSSVKAITEELLGRECEKLEGYGATFVHSMKQLATRLDPTDFPPDTVMTPEGIRPNQKERELE
jgi:hypothetical protein